MTLSKKNLKELFVRWQMNEFYQQNDEKHIENIFYHKSIVKKKEIIKKFLKNVFYNRFILLFQ